ncbi:hypothetical protein CR983_01530 [Candidatus Saccharibacteria bacterium]|nr:MAG: hypothetical protein CR983_01530 [Candidatus Saccharibacteria bacterium]
MIYLGRVDNLILPDRVTTTNRASDASDRARLITDVYTKLDLFDSARAEEMSDVLPPQIEKYMRHIQAESSSLLS